MRKMVKFFLLLCFVICLYYYAVVEAVDCDNGAVYCRDYETYLTCYISNNDTELIKSLLKTCSSQSTVLYYIYLFKDYYSTTYGQLIIDIDLPSNMRSLYIYNDRDQDHFRLTTSGQNIGLTRISCNHHVEIESHDFFNNFVGLQYIYMSYIISKEKLSFTNLQYLISLSARIIGPGTHTFDNTIVRGLSNLRYLSISSSNFNGITGDAFDNLIMLTYLNFDSNRLSIIEDGAFTELSSLRSLSLGNNGIKIISGNIFESLHGLTYLRISGNLEFPMITLLHARSLVCLFLEYNGYQTLDSYIFQQMNSLRDLYVNNPFICSCELQWVSIVSQYELTIHNGVCSEPYYSFENEITNPQLYTNCSQTESYECFNKSITCPSKKVCHNTEDGYLCGCPIGYLLHNSGECKDFDECDEVTNCTYACENTEGSYHCVCDEGFKLASNGYDCDDVNECQVSNGGCEFGCGNTKGSFECYCEYGRQLINKTHCEERFECELIEESCINSLESKYYWKGWGTTVMLIQSVFVWNVPTVIVLWISLVSNVILIVMLITLLIYFVKNNNKMQSILKAKEPKKPRIYTGCYNNETIYNNCMDESAHLDKLKKTSSESEPMEKNHPNLLTEVCRTKL